MDGLAPPLAALMQVRWEMENGCSIREALRAYLGEGGNDAFMRTVRAWTVRKSHGQPCADLLHAVRSPYRRALLDLLERGWEGEPILEALDALEEEIREASQSEMDHFVASLPFRAMLPLLLLQFPAYLLLLLGPVCADLMQSLGGS